MEDEQASGLGAKKVREGVAVLTAAIVVLGGGAAVIALMVVGTVEADAGLPIVAGLVSGGSVFLWNAKSAKDAKDAALAVPGKPEE